MTARVLEKSGELRELDAARERVLSELECEEVGFWCFTRAAMRQHDLCSCAHCKRWRDLAAEADAADEGDDEGDE